MAAAPEALDPAKGVIRWLEEHWRDPDDGIWEVRGPRRQFVHSKVMAWVAADRLTKVLEVSGVEAPLEGLVRRATISTTRCVGRDTTRSGTRSRSTTGPPSSTPPLL